MQVRIGDILVDQGILSREQVDRVLLEQQTSSQPFGAICERLFNISCDAVEEAWAIQYVGLTRKVDPRIESVEERALTLVTRRQAWQFRVMPIRFDGDELMMATTPRHLRRALRFATKFIAVPVFFVMSDPRALGEALCARYALAGMTPASIDDDALDRLLALTKSSAA